jgi:Lon protease-like protein
VSEIGLFPLSLVLLPTERVPLHIFEPRYKELIGECLARDIEFGLVFADDEGLREIGTQAAVTKVVERFEDGRMNVLVEGRERFRLVTLTEGRSFQTAEIELVADEHDEPGGVEVEHALELFSALREISGASVDDPDPDTGPISFQLAARVDFGAEVKQQLLELRSEPQRLQAVTELLDGAVETLALERDLSGRASGNGKVSLD